METSREIRTHFETSQEADVLKLAFEGDMLQLTQILAELTKLVERDGSRRKDELFELLALIGDDLDLARRADVETQFLESRHITLEELRAGRTHVESGEVLTRGQADHETRLEARIRILVVLVAVFPARVQLDAVDAVRAAQALRVITHEIPFE